MSEKPPTGIYVWAVVVIGSLAIFILPPVCTISSDHFCTVIQGWEYGSAVTDILKFWCVAVHFLTWIASVAVFLSAISCLGDRLRQESKS